MVQSQQCPLLLRFCGVVLFMLFFLGGQSQSYSGIQVAATSRQPYSWTLTDIATGNIISSGAGSVVVNTSGSRADRPYTSGGDWQYGLSMSPSYSSYYGIEMPTAGMHWTTAPNNAEIFFWESSTTSNGNFAQNGYGYNGLNSYLCVESGPTCIPPHSWGMFWTYTDPGYGYIGNGILAPTGWNAGDHIYFSIAKYSGRYGIFVFWATDATNGQRYAITLCDYSIAGAFQGGVGGIAEGGPASGYGNVYLDQITLWAQSGPSGSRVSDTVRSYNPGGAPSNVLTYIEGRPSYGIFQLGFNQGIQYANGVPLSGGSASYPVEYYPTIGSCS